DEIDKHVNSSKIGSNGYIYILDQNYNVLSCNSNINITPFLESEQSKKIFKNIKKDALSYKSYFFEYNLEDTKTLASYHLISGCSWIVVVAIPHSEINHSSFFINNIII
ncbi:Cache 3/Cache 2 fusion domain-containing protein, partial [Clostridium paraputrificum]